MNTKELLQGIKTYGKQKVMLYDDLEKIQKYVADCRTEGKQCNIIAPQKGFQEIFLVLANCVDTVILSGNRGGGKSYSCPLAFAGDITSEGFNTICLRRGKLDADKKGGLTDLFKTFYKDISTFIESKRILKIGKGSGEVVFSYFGDGMQGDAEETGMSSFSQRLQGLNANGVCVDEIFQCSEDVFSYLQTILRSTNGIKTKFVGAGNPNPDSFWAKVISWWLDPDTGVADPKRSGKVRYYFQYGDSMEESFWGSSYHEVFVQAKDDINRLFGTRKEITEENARDYIRSITFIDADLSANKILLSQDAGYQSRLVSDAQSSSINLLGSWFKVSKSEEWLSYELMNDFLCNNEESDTSDKGEMYASLDIAYGLGDMTVLGIFKGHFLIDLQFTKKQMTTSEFAAWVRFFLKKWNVPENRLCYDGLGAPHLRPEFPLSVPILRKVVEGKVIGGISAKDYFADLKTQLCFEMIKRLEGAYNNGKCGFGINPNLLNIPYDKTNVRETFLRQRKAVRKSNNDNGKNAIIKKKEAKVLVGCSPDLIEGTLIYRSYFDLVSPKFNINHKTLNRLMLC